MNTRTALMLVAVLATTTAAAFAEGPGTDTYKSKCAMCHGPDGMATGPAGKAMKVPPITSAEYKGSEAELMAATKAGKGKMPAFAGKLTDGQIKDVISYMRTLQK